MGISSLLVHHLLTTVIMMMYLRLLFLAYLAMGQQDHPGDELEPTENKRTRKRSPFPWNGCTKSKPCGVGQGDCDGDHECQAGTKCGYDNCKDFNANAHPRADCCFGGPCKECNDGWTRIGSSWFQAFPKLVPRAEAQKFC